MSFRITRALAILSLATTAAASAPAASAPRSVLPPSVAAALSFCTGAGDDTPAFFRAAACDVVLDTAVATSDERVQAHYGRALARRVQGRLADAIGDLDAAIGQSSDDVLLLVTRGDIRHETGNEDGALDDYARAVRLAPDDPRPRNGRVDMLVQRARYAEAIADFDVLLRHSDDPGLYYNGRGVARWRLIKTSALFAKPAALDQVLADFTRSVETMSGPARSSPLFNRAELLLERSLWHEALKDYEEALKLRPDNTRYLLGRARAKKGIGDLAGAKADYDRIAMLPTVLPWTEEAREERRMIAPPGDRDGFRGATELTVLDACADYDASTTREPIIKIRLSESSRKSFATLTAEHIGARLELVLDGRVLATPLIREPVTGGYLQISGGFTLQEAQITAERLMQPDVRIEVRLVASDGTR